MESRPKTRIYGTCTDVQVKPGSVDPSRMPEPQACDMSLLSTTLVRFRKDFTPRRVVSQWEISVASCSP
jgi:hypothetical protein